MTGADRDLLDSVVAMTPSRILRLLDEASGGSDSVAVALHLLGGQVLTGRLLSVATDQGHEVAVLHDPRTGSLGYVLTVHVIAVVVADPGPFTDVVTAGRLPVPGEEGETSRLAMRREFGPDGPFPVEVDWDSLPDRGSTPANLARLLRGLRAAADTVRSDEMGRAAWDQAGALHVGHRDGADLTVETAADGLTVYADLGAALPRDLPAALLHKINAVL